MPLTLAPIGKELTIRKIVVEEKLKKHLEDLGITINSKITVISQNGGNLICLVKNVRLALDKNTALKIFVM